MSCVLLKIGTLHGRDVPEHARGSFSKIIKIEGDVTVCGYAVLPSIGLGFAEIFIIRYCGFMGRCGFQFPLQVYSVLQRSPL